MKPKIMKCIVSGKWVIVTGATKKHDGLSIAHKDKKHYIPDEIIQQIVLTELIEGIPDGYDKGYKQEVDAPDGRNYVITVERIDAEGPPRCTPPPPGGS